MKKNLPEPKSVPPKYKFRNQAMFSRKFLWKERLKILFGYQAHIVFEFHTEHNSGRFNPFAQVTITDKDPVTGKPQVSNN